MMGDLVRNDWEMGLLWAAIGLALVLIPAAIALYLLKRRHQSDQWRLKVPRFTRLVFDRTVGMVICKVPWKPLLIWGPWVGMLLVFGFYSIENWRGARAWEQKKQDLLKRGEPLGWSDFAPVVPVEENFLLHPRVQPHITGTSSGMAVNPGLRTRDQIGGMLDAKAWARSQSGRVYSTREDALAAIESAMVAVQARLGDVESALARNPKWPTFWYNEGAELQRNLFRGVLNSSVWYREFEGRGYLRALKGDVKGGLEDLRAMEKLAQFAYLGTPDVSKLGGLSNLVWELLYTAGADPEQLAMVEERLGQYDCYDIARLNHQADRILLLEEVEEGANNRSELKDEWDISFFDLYADWMPDELEDGQTWVNQWILRMAPRGWFDGWKAKSAQFYDDLLISGAHWEEDLDLLDELKRRGLPKGGPFWFMSAQGSAPIREQTQIDLTRIAIQLERYRKQHGHYPERLQDLVPGFLTKLPIDRGDKEAYRYRLLEGGLPKLYGVGRDGVDDGASPTRNDDIWWFFPPLKTESKATPNVESP